MKNKRIGVLLFLIIITIMFSGCNGSMGSINTESQAKDVTETETISQTDTESELVETREVVFLNYIVSAWGMDAALWHQVELHNVYGIVEDENTLYAFSVNCNNPSEEHKHLEDYPTQGTDEDYETYAERKKEYLLNLHKELLLAEELLIVENYPDESVVVAGTMQELKRVFLDMQGKIGECIFCAKSVTRPDNYDVLEETGYTQEDIDRWFGCNAPKMPPFLGTDANQVTLTVPVIVPDETTETE